MKNLHCLVIDDDPTMHKLIGAILRSKTDWSMESAYNGNEAIEMANKIHPDVIFCDFHMDGKDGMTVMKELNTFENNEMIKIFITSDSEKNVIAEAIKSGAHYFINKAKLLEEFTKTVEAIKKYFIEK